MSEQNTTSEPLKDNNSDANNQADFQHKTAGSEEQESGGHSSSGNKTGELGLSSGTGFKDAQ